MSINLKKISLFAMSSILLIALHRHQIEHLLDPTAYKIDQISKKFFSQAQHIEPYITGNLFALAKKAMQEKNEHVARTAFSMITTLSTDNDKKGYAHIQLGHLYNNGGQPDKAIQEYKHALTHIPNSPRIHYNIGFTLYSQLNINQALEYLDRAIELNPDYSQAHIIRANCYLFQEKFDKCYDEFACAWKTEYKDGSIPFWDGSPLKQKTILLRGAFGLGDSIQGIRYAKQLKKQGARILCNLQKPLRPLLQTYPYIDKFVEKESIDEPIDYQALLPNMPMICRSTPATTPQEIPYIRADTRLKDMWQKKMDPGFKVGICSYVDEKHDEIKLPISRRSIPQELLSQLGDIKDIHYYSLQKNNAQHSPVPGLKIHNFGPDFDTKHGSFMDSAAIIENLDLVITVDTAIAHLAGALGKKVWVLLPYSPDPRWLLNKKTTHWYPTMKLFRQSEPGNWNSVMRMVKNELKEEVKHNNKEQ